MAGLGFFTSAPLIRTVRTAIPFNPKRGTVNGSAHVGSFWSARFGLLGLDPIWAQLSSLEEGSMLDSFQLRICLMGFVRLR